MKSFFILTLLFSFLISCNNKVDVPPVKETKTNIKKAVVAPPIKDSINFDLINLANLEKNKADTFYFNYINHYITKNDTNKVNLIWNFVKKHKLKLPKVYVTYAYFINSNKTQNDKAIAIYKEAIAMDPSYYLPYKIIGNLYIHYNMMQDALNYLDAAHKLEPKDVEIINNIANIYFVNKQYDIAISFYTKAIETSPNEVVYFNRAICYDNLGKPTLAKQDRVSAESYK